jgi:hypothetical protein
MNKNEEKIILAGFFRDGRCAVPTKDNADSKGWVCAIDRNSSGDYVMLNVNNRIDWSKYIWLDATVETLTLPKALATMQIYFSDVHSVTLENCILNFYNHDTVKLQIKATMPVTPVQLEDSKLQCFTYPLKWVSRYLQKDDYCRVRNSEDEAWSENWKYIGEKGTQFVVYRDDEVIIVNECQKLSDVKRKPLEKVCKQK